MFCRYCGKKIPDDSIFCPKCGRSLAKSDTQEAPPSPVAAPQKERADAAANRYVSTHTPMNSQTPTNAQTPMRAHTPTNAQTPIRDVRHEPERMPEREARTFTEPPVAGEWGKYIGWSDGTAHSQAAGRMDSRILIGRDIDISPNAEIYNTRKASSNFMHIASVTVAAVSLVLFLILYIKMAPGFGDLKILTYIAGAVAACVAFGLLIIFMIRRSTKALRVASILLSFVVIAFSSGAHAIYTAKYEDAHRYVPSDEFVNIHLDVLDVFPTDIPEENVTVEISQIEIEDEEVFSAIGAGTHLVKISVIDLSGNLHTGSTEISFDPQKLKLGQSVIVDTDEASEIRVLTVELRLTRVMSFWEVVTH